MTDGMCEQIARELTVQLAERDHARTPDEVARFGAKDVQERAGASRLDGARAGVLKREKIPSAQFESVRAFALVGL